MALTLFIHPLSSFCHKALFALYENGTPFEKKDVNLHHDSVGVDEAKADIQTGYHLFEKQFEQFPWVAGPAMTIADCASLPVLFYGSAACPFEGRFPNLQKQLDKLLARPSVKKILNDAKPYFQYFPFADRLPAFDDLS